MVMRPVLHRLSRILIGYCVAAFATGACVLGGASVLAFVQKAMTGAGVGQLLECGPGKVLSGLNRRIDKSLQSYSLEVPDSLQAAAEELN